MVALGFILLALLPVSLFYCFAYLIELFCTWKNTTVGAKLKMAFVSIISAVVFAASYYFLFIFKL